MRHQFLEPLRAVYPHATTIRNCPAESDWDWLRQGAGKGRKVLWVWDKAGVDLSFWQERQVAGIYFTNISFVQSSDAVLR